MLWPNSDADHLIVSSSQMQEIEHQLFSLGMPVEALMEKVGLEMKKWFLKNPKLLQNGVVVLIGPGHNGGDGLVLARELYLSGIDVSLWSPLPIKKSLTAKHLHYCISIGINQLNDTPEPTGNELWIEAIFGLGQTSAIPKEIGQILQKREKLNPNKLISLDVPAGICSDTGKRFEAFAAKASFTLTVGLIKSGLIQDVALPYVGNLIRIEIGIPEFVLKTLPEFVPLKISPKDIASFSFPETAPNSSKYERGRLLTIAGSYKYRGASALALQGALASGVGSVQAIVPQSISDALWVHVPEVVFHDYCDKSKNHEIHLSKCLSKVNFDRIDALLIGPGIGSAEESWEDFAFDLEQFRGLLVLDADALNRLAISPEGWKWLTRRQGMSLITPHLNEFHRLFPDVVASSPLEAATLAARISGAAVLLKGAHSVIATPTGFSWQIVDTSRYVARTGLGDVLAGFIAGVGALEFSSGSNLNFDLFAFAALIHSYSAKTSEQGTNAECVAKNLAGLVKNLQSQKVRIDT